MINEDYKYVWENRRNVYRVVIDNPTYNPETKKTTHHYVTVGKASSKGGPIEFGPKFKAVEKAKSDVLKAKQVILSGEKIVLDNICSKIGLKNVLTKSFSKDLAEKIINLACYLVCTGDALSNADTWLNERGMKSIEAPRVSELLPQLTDESCSTFFKEWTGKNAKDKTLCYDVTSVSTYSKEMDRAEFGYNRDHEKWLKQINLAMLTDKENHLPLAFRVVNGSLTDVQTLKDTVTELKMYGASPYGIVMDRGFWSADKLQMLSDNNIKYMIPVPTSVAWAKKLIADHCNDVFSSRPYTNSLGEATYSYTVYDPTNSGKRIWAHIYYSPSIETDRKERFVSKYVSCRAELENNTPNEKHQSFYNDYFTLSTRGRGGKLHVEEKKPLSDIISEAKFGYWVLYTDMEKDSVTALKDYMDRIFIEAGFDDLKGSTDAKRLRVHYDKSVYGRIFIQFCAQIIRTALRNQISKFDAKTRKYASSPDTVFSRVRMFSKVSYQGRYKAQYSVMTKGQKLIFKALGIEVKEAEETDEEDTENLLS